MVTIYDIAKSAGVSPSTVSKALRGSTDLNPDTANKIKSIAQKLGYNISRLHSGSGSSSTIGVVFMELRSEYYNGIYDAMREKLESSGYRLVTMLADFNDEKHQLDCINYLIKSRVGGIIFLTEIDIDISKLRDIMEKSGIPMVLITRMSRIDFCDVISVNHHLGVKMAVEYLHNCGHRKIAFIGEPFTARREHAFKETMTELNLELPEEYVIISKKRYCAGGYEAAQRLLDLPYHRLPTAVFAAYDHLAFGAMKALREAGVYVPEDISMVGVDDNQMSAYISPALTSVRMPVESVGEQAAGMLIARIAGSKSPYQTVYLTPEIKYRDSVENA